jgi:hypothetical protein
MLSPLHRDFRVSDVVGVSALAHLSVSICAATVFCASVLGFASLTIMALMLISVAVVIGYLLGISLLISHRLLTADRREALDIAFGWWGRSFSWTR